MQSFIKFIAFIAFFSPGILFSQSNNNCTGATLIADPANFCSALQAGTTTGATGSSQPASSCFGATMRDVWYRFTAVASEVTIVINGDTELTPGGTLTQPSVGLYSGTCSNLTEIACAEDGGFLFGDNIVELRRSGLTPGTEYFIRVAGVFAGTFQYCVRNFAFGGGVSGDCPVAIVLCDKSPFNVQAVTGPGSNDTEMDDANCFNDGIPLSAVEQNSTWYVFTAANNGTLEFTLTPNNPDDDLDFVLYRLPNGPGNCSGKQVLRCMASGDDATFGHFCVGPTGLNAASTDISEPPGCPPGSDRFLSSVNMTAGTTYALVVNNFSSSGNGFQMVWGGTGEFRGPKAGIKTNDPDNKICLGQSLIFSDSSTSNGNAITSYNWNFGVGANVATATGIGPHTITYQTPGTKIVSLKIKTPNGCEVNTTRQIDVTNCCTLTPQVTLDTLNCSARAAVRVPVATGTVTIKWSNGQTGETTIFDTAGNHSVTVEDAAGCVGTVSFVVVLPQKPQIRVNIAPGCSSAAASATVTSGKAPYTITWSTGATGLSVAGLAAGSYMASVTDANGCSDTAQFTITLPPPVVATVQQTSLCRSANATVTIENATAPVQIKWSNGQTAAIATGFSNGTHSVIVTDAKGCADTTTFTVELSTALEVTVKTTPGCTGDAGATAVASVVNGKTPYQLVWSNAQTGTQVQGLTAGNYSVIATDSLGCKDTTAFTVANPVLFAAKFPNDTTILTGGKATLTITSPFSGVTAVWEAPGQTLNGLSVSTAPTQTVTYAVTATLGNCQVRDSVKVTVLFDVFEIPNAFTPDGDQMNDQFGPVLSGYEQLQMQIWSRWGELIYNETTGRWDGTVNGLPAPTDVYIYRISVKKRDGTIPAPKTGQVTLLR